jgi:hypothetical protein
MTGSALAAVHRTLLQGGAEVGVEKGEPEPGDGNPNPTPPETSDDDPVDFGIPIALDREVSCSHGFDPPYCPFGCA